ncbi:hypothetical protein [Acinetobacter sp. WCHAc060007]|uniref:hypothetical protein n=1 Tax=Acinetobacter sp. WCHAc060007 TaxID=2419605 RepID=UPI000EA0CFB6|nr:hypothetical protein [Acinetobacter sp. WCHAc060007]RKG37349.1 hypothetical protein D7V31_16650 [Acinetobacter sp. WCHAc060007]
MVADDFYTVAENLLSNLPPNEEAMLRTVVGRAYYAVYLSTRDWINCRFSKEISDTEGNSHEKYTNCLKNLQRVHFDLSLSRFARELCELKDKRHFADYCIGDDDIQDEINTREAMLQAKKLLNDLDVLKSKYP